VLADATGVVRETRRAAEIASLAADVLAGDRAGR
jgi:hypothetical protein